MKSYAHSKAFESLKGIKEEITGNFTSPQYLNALDLFLWNALEPIHAECPSFFNNYITKVVARQTLKASTKFTSLTQEDRAKLPVLLFNALTQPDARKAHEHVRSMLINRGLLFGFIVLFLAKLRRYETLQSAFYPMDPIARRSEIYYIERSIGLRPNGSLFGCIQQVRHFYQKAAKFKEMIMEKYTRMTLMQAKRTYEDFNHYVPLDDVVQIHLLTTSKAIDRCDSRQGVLTTFIQNWFKSSRSEVSDLAKSQTDQSIESLNDDHGDASAAVLGFTMPDTSAELEQHLSYVAKTVDPQGYLRSILGIQEHLTRDQIETLVMFSV